MIEADIPTIPVRRLHNYVYCPRLMYFQFAENIFVYDSEVIEGQDVHRRVDEPTPAYPDELLSPARETIRSLAVEDTARGFAGVIDLLRKNDDGSWTLYDYKRGSPLTDDHRKPVAKEADALQTQAYACLAELRGINVSAGFVYYAGSKTFAAVDLEDMHDKVQQVIASVRKTLCGPMPAPLIDDNRCLFCSMYPVCLPDETLIWKRQHRLVSTVRPPLTEDDPGEVVIVQNPRAWLSKKGDTIAVSVDGRQLSTHPLHALRSIFIYGAAQLSTQLIHTCLTNGVNVSFFSPAGKYLGRLESLVISGLDSRHGQYEIASRESFLSILERIRMSYKDLSYWGSAS